MKLFFCITKTGHQRVRDSSALLTCSLLHLQCSGTIIEAHVGVVPRCYHHWLSYLHILDQVDPSAVKFWIFAVDLSVQS